MTDFIKIRGAREHNLKNIDLDIPKNKMVIFTGVSGSGKSSLAMDTIYAEGQRRYVESLSSYARQFLGVMNKPDMEYIEGLSPAIAIDQKTTSHNPRSTVGTVTEVYDYLRVLFARVGRIYDPKTGKEIKRQSPEEISNTITELLEQDSDIKNKGLRSYLLSPVVRGRKGEYSKLLQNLQKQGFSRARIDGEIYNLNQEINLIKTNKHDIDVVVDRIIFTKKTLDNDDMFKDFKSRLFQSVESALRLSNGIVIFSKILDSGSDESFPENPKDFEETSFSENFAFEDTDIDFPEVEPRLFSFNTPYGACPNCDGLGTVLEFDENYVMNKDLSVMEGGIFPIGNIAEKETWFKRKIESVAEKEKINLHTAIKNIREEKLNILLYGPASTRTDIDQKENSHKGDKDTINNEKEVELEKKTYVATGPNSSGKIVSFDFEWEGILTNLENKYSETESDYVRNELEKYMIKKDCPDCEGARLKKESLYVKIDGLNIADVASLAIKDSYDWIQNAKNSKKLTKREKEIGEPIFKEVETRLKFLNNVGLEYLSIDRTSSTLAGGEAQRIRLASQIGTGLSGVLYVLDEPSIGLHAIDHSRLITTLKKLKSLGNTVLVVEHDASTMLESDHIIDFGPGAGELGGEVVAQGTPDELMNNPKSLTGKYLSGKKRVNEEDYMTKEDIENLVKVQKKKGKQLKLSGSSGHNLKNIDVEITLNTLTCVTGVSGSGKSTLVNETLLRQLREELGLKNDEAPKPNKGLAGHEHIDKLLNIDQSPIGRTPRSNPATYTKAFDEIRKIFSKTKESRVRGYKPGRFSFNVKGGRCEACKGDGQIKIEMQFMPDVYVNCEVCNGKRYTDEVLDIYYKDKNIADILDMTVDEALGFFNSIPNIERKLRTLSEVGLGYIRLGQPAPTLSGGEAQRVKLASELAKMPRGHTLYILDEPTTGLHFADLERLIAILKKLVAKGNTVLVIEHNLDVIKASDWIIDLGPGGGADGGRIMFKGTPEDIIKDKDSKTGLALREMYYV